MSKPRRHLFIPDCQVQPGVRTSHLEALGNYVAHWQPDVIINAGDFYDMKSLCVYDRDLADVTTRRYAADIGAGDAALATFMKPWYKIKKYRPRLIYTLGNHEERANRLIDEQPKLRGAVAMPWDYAAARSWEIHPYLQPVVVDGVAYCHLFVKGANGRVTNIRFGAANARTQVMREMRSCTAGHKPGLDVHIQPIGTGSMRGVIAGSFYQHEEAYMTPQGDTYWRGVLMKHEVHKGNYDLMEVSLKYLLRKWL